MASDAFATAGERLGPYNPGPHATVDVGGARRRMFVVRWQRCGRRRGRRSAGGRCDGTVERDATPAEGGSSNDGSGPASCPAPQSVTECPVADGGVCVLDDDPYYGCAPNALPSGLACSGQEQCSMPILPCAGESRAGRALDRSTDTSARASAVAGPARTATWAMRSAQTPAHPATAAPEAESRAASAQTRDSSR